MTVANSNNRDRLTADGVLTDFDFTFKIYADTEILVYTVDNSDAAALKVLVTDYTVTINTVTEGGTVSYVTPPTDTYEVLMIRSLPYTQGADIPVNEGFSEVVIENALDKLAIQIQQLKDLNDRTVSLSLTSSISSVTLPDPVDKKALVWSGSLGLMTNSEIDVGDFDAAVAAASASAAAALVSENAAAADVVLTAADVIAAAASAAAALVSENAAAAAAQALYPVGINVTLGVATAPATLFGFGTWTAIAGQVIVGKAGAGTFNTLNATGGAETVSIAHTHDDGSYATATGTSGGPSATVFVDDNSGGSDYNVGSETHTHSIPSLDVTGSSGAMSANATPNILQPYIVKYIWERTA